MLKEKGQLKFEDKWSFMRPTVLKLLKQEAVTPVEWQELFYDVHLVCLWDEKGPIKLRDALHDDIVQYIKQAQGRVMAQQREETLLKAYIVEWQKFFTQCNYLPTPFRQLESSLQGKTTGSSNVQGTAVKKGQNNDSIVRKLMLDCWNNSIFNNIKDRLQDSAMRLIYLERNGEAFDSQLVTGVRDSFVNLCSNPDDHLKIYREYFEATYINSTTLFYKLKVTQQLNENGVIAYMKYAEQKLKEEEARAKKYLEAGSNRVVDCCVKVLVQEPIVILLNECKPLIKAGETERLQLLYRLLGRVEEGIVPMQWELEQHIEQEGLAEMVAAADVITLDSEKYVERLLELYRKFTDLVHEAFSDDPRFLTSRDKAFKKVVNDTKVFSLDLNAGRSAGGKSVAPESKCPELLANYCDMLLRRTPLSKRLTSDEIDSRLKDVLLLLKYVNNKDVFMRYHKAHLTRRLIVDASIDSEKEEDMVEWLREVGMPADYVNKLARMFQDIKVSEDLNSQFRTSTAKHDAINIKILNAGAWARFSERVTVSLPVELEDYIPEIEEFYRKKHSGRKLLWYHHMSNGTINFAVNGGKFDLDVTTFQMAVLFAWNQRPNDKITYENLRLATELPNGELRRTLWSLVAFPKLKRQLLMFSPPVNSAKEFTEDTVFWVNQDFALVKNGKPQKRGKVNLIGRLQLSTESSQIEDNQSIVQLRILRTQEAIIKILKMRKKITNAALQTELVDILKNMFIPTKKMIKEQLEWLIEHKYMKRDDDDINTFIYMA
ncbi:cullin-5 isoform X1 [Coccinella septempunctata]|uniref:cullin-5 isoform X1 n=2 Tax=Coccinella septempunctata TaxID=41139 RepID=UPI001D096CA3|nr:cullin-5 isoform X1 [Coccinella septempunctata]